MGSDRHCNSGSRPGTGSPGPDKGPRSLPPPCPGLLLACSLLFWALFRVGLAPAAPSERSEAPACQDQLVP